MTSIGLNTVLQYLREADLDNNQRVSQFRSAEMTLARHNASADQQFEVAEFVKFFGLFNDAVESASWKTSNGLGYSHQDLANFAALSGDANAIEESDLTEALKSVVWSDNEHGQNKERSTNYLRGAIRTQYKRNELVSALQDPSLMAQVDTNPATFNVPIDDVTLVAQELEQAMRNQGWKQDISPYFENYIAQEGADSYKGRIASAIQSFYQSTFAKYAENNLEAPWNAALGYFYLMSNLQGDKKFLTAAEIQQFDQQMFSTDPQVFLKNVTDFAWSYQSPTNVARRFFEVPNYDVVQLRNDTDAMERQLWENQYKSQMRQMGDAPLVQANVPPTVNTVPSIIPTTTPTTPTTTTTTISPATTPSPSTGSAPSVGTVVVGGSNNTSVVVSTNQPDNITLVQTGNTENETTQVAANSNTTSTSQTNSQASTLTSGASPNNTDVLELVKTLLMSLIEDLIKYFSG